MAALTSGSYFQFFNDITYANTPAIDITERVIVNNKEVISNPYIYYPVDIQEGFRADNLAQNAYQNPFYSWMIYLSNDIIDPYYDWYLSTEQFNQFIIDKYGSYQAAESKVAYYVNNWADQPDIDVATYNALAPDSLRYWTPNYNYNTIYSYSRIKEDWTTTTNFIVQLNLSGVYNFNYDEIVYITYGGTTDSNGNSILQANGQAQVLAFSSNASSNTTTLMIRHLYLTNNAFQYASANNTKILGTANGSESFANAGILNAYYVSNNISAASASYWAPVYYYDMETQKNESKKTINMLKPDYVTSFVQTTKTLLANVSF